MCVKFCKIGLNGFKIERGELGGSRLPLLLLYVDLVWAP